MVSNKEDKKMKSEEIEIQSGKIWITEDGIFRYTFFPGAEITVEKVKESFAVHEKITGGKQTPVLIDIRGLKSITREAREYLSGGEAQKIVLAHAILIGSPVSKVIGNFFLGLNKPSYPTKLFTSEAKALEWLKGFVEKEE